ncbi:Dehydrogenase/reductase SDR family member on chromosome X [Camelus dromedarius]|uniref:Dehydrogenase/reductase SDR family member on chromosome X n=1 Tax=Camelus dromedarius TaxID=9838 RepID=A0A5N4C1E7_CAMDR|nr:Dehydrogenase/reductase SDR family member on chromosome X [Camelus dromedarius]
MHPTCRASDGQEATGGPEVWCRAVAVMGSLMATPEEGSWTSVYAAVSPALEGVGGRYLYNEKETRSLAITYDRKLQRQLWARSCQLTGTADVTQDALSG